MGALAPGALGLHHDGLHLESDGDHLDALGIDARAAEDRRGSRRGGDQTVGAHELLEDGHAARRDLPGGDREPLPRVLEAHGADLRPGALAGGSARLHEAAPRADRPVVVQAHDERQPGVRDHLQGSDPEAPHVVGVDELGVRGDEPVAHHDLGRRHAHQVLEARRRLRRDAHAPHVDPVHGRVAHGEGLGTRVVEGQHDDPHPGRREGPRQALGVRLDAADVGAPARAEEADGCAHPGGLGPRVGTSSGCAPAAHPPSSPLARSSVTTSGPLLSAFQVEG